MAMSTKAHDEMWVALVELYRLLGLECPCLYCEPHPAHGPEACH